MTTNQIDDLDIYHDLDDFQEQEEKKSKEYEALASQLKDAMVSISASKAEKKVLQAKLKILERNFQLLLETSRAEINRKNNQIAELQREKDSIVFRRKKPITRVINHTETKTAANHKPANPFNPFKSTTTTNNNNNNDNNLPTCDEKTKPKDEEIRIESKQNEIKETAKHSSRHEEKETKRLPKHSPEYSSRHEEKETKRLSKHSPEKRDSDRRKAGDVNSKDRILEKYEKNDKRSDDRTSSHSSRLNKYEQRQRSKEVHMERKSRTDVDKRDLKSAARDKDSHSRHRDSEKKSVHSRDRSKTEKDSSARNRDDKKKSSHKSEHSRSTEKHTPAKKRVSEKSSHSNKRSDRSSKSIVPSSKRNDNSREDRKSRSEKTKSQTSTSTQQNQHKPLMNGDIIEVDDSDSDDKRKETRQEIKTKQIEILANIQLPTLPPESIQEIMHGGGAILKRLSAEYEFQTDISNNIVLNDPTNAETQPIDEEMERETNDVSNVIEYFEIIESSEDDIETEDEIVVINQEEDRVAGNSSEIKTEKHVNNNQETATNFNNSKKSIKAGNSKDAKNDLESDYDNNYNDENMEEVHSHDIENYPKQQIENDTNENEGNVKENNITETYDNEMENRNHKDINVNSNDNLLIENNEIQSYDSEVNHKEDKDVERTACFFEENETKIKNTENAFEQNKNPVFEVNSTKLTKSPAHSVEIDKELKATQVLDTRISTAVIDLHDITSSENSLTALAKTFSDNDDNVNNANDTPPSKESIYDSTVSKNNETTFDMSNFEEKMCEEINHSIEKELEASKYVDLFNKFFASPSQEAESLNEKQKTSLEREKVTHKKTTPCKHHSIIESTNGNSNLENDMPQKFSFQHIQNIVNACPKTFDAIDSPNLEKTPTLSRRKRKNPSETQINKNELKLTNVPAHKLNPSSLPASTASSVKDEESKSQSKQAFEHSRSSMDNPVFTTDSVEEELKLPNKQSLTYLQSSLVKSAETSNSIEEEAKGSAEQANKQLLSSLEYSVSILDSVEDGESKSQTKHVLEHPLSSMDNPVIITDSVEEELKLPNKQSLTYPQSSLVKSASKSDSMEEEQFKRPTKKTNKHPLSSLDNSTSTSVSIEEKELTFSNTQALKRSRPSSSSASVSNDEESCQKEHKRPRLHETTSNSIEKLSKHLEPPADTPPIKYDVNNSLSNSLVGKQNDLTNPAESLSNSFQELDARMQEIFRTSSCEDVSKSESISIDISTQLSNNSCDNNQNITIEDTAVEEKTCSLEQSSISGLNSSTEVKRLSMGGTDYQIGRTSDNELIIFVQRKPRTKKNKKNSVK